MTYFLERIARLLYDQYNGDIKNHCLVFPGRRAGLYFLKYYASQLEKPAWTPAILTINEFFGSFSDLIVGDTEILLFELYKVYRKLNKSAESFDEFYFWGDMLINDFDDVDKYMADASVMFRNVSDYKTIDSLFGDIDSEKAAIIKRFWVNFDADKQSPQKTGFISIWSILNEIYNGFRSSLRSQNLAYEGMTYRDVAESYKTGRLKEIKWDMVHFIGFNALNKCELTVMEKLQELAKAKFYWDYDDSYVGKGVLNSAGMFMSKNLRKLNNDMPADWSYKMLSSAGLPAKKIRIIETTSDIAQVKMIPDLVGQIPGLKPEDTHHTAIILTDENLIVPVLTSLPDAGMQVNITMGYPMKMTGVYNLIKHLLDYQRNLSRENDRFYSGYSEVLSVLRHQLIEKILDENDKSIQSEIIKKNLTHVSDKVLLRSDTLTRIFRAAENPHDLSEYIKEVLLLVSTGKSAIDGTDANEKMQENLRNEFIYSAMLAVNRLDSILNSSEISFRNDTYIRILDKILRNQSVPFTGEPLAGIQIMGFLETRALDFKNIIMLSVNEGNLPSLTSSSSFIPFSIREAFDLPLINHQESIYAYHFYRLMQRVENVTFLYNSDSTGLRTGEMSRFLIQMRYEKLFDPVISNLSFDIMSPVSISQEIQKNDYHLEKLNSLYKGSGRKASLSPTAVNTWLACRMRFYYRYVNRLKEPEVLIDDIDHAAFGHILHQAMKNIYSNSLNTELSHGFYDPIIKNDDLIRETVKLAICSGYLSDENRSFSGSDLIIQEIIFTYIKKILAADKHFSPLKILQLEAPFSFRLTIGKGSNESYIFTGGDVDRIDSQSGTVRIVDYKTGETASKINSISDLFEDDRKKDIDGWLQTLIYCEAYISANPGVIVRPSIYKVKELSSGKISDTLEIAGEDRNQRSLVDYQSVRTEFISGLKELTDTIFSQDEPFRMTKTTSKCGYCPYRALCQR